MPETNSVRPASRSERLAKFQELLVAAEMVRKATYDLGLDGSVYDPNIADIKARMERIRKEV